MKILVWYVRDSKNISLRELEKRTGISKTTLNDIERELISPTLQQLKSIADALNVKISDLYEENE